MRRFFLAGSNAGARIDQQWNFQCLDKLGINGFPVLSDQKSSNDTVAAELKSFLRSLFFQEAVAVKDSLDALV